MNSALPCSYAADYVSPTRRPGWFRRAFPGFVFYVGFCRIVVQASRKARRGAYDDAAFVASSAETIRLLESLGTRFTIENVAAFDRLNGPAVVIGNHMSTLETFALACMVLPHRPVAFIVKRALVETPIFKHVMLAVRPIVVGRASAREDLRTVTEEGEAMLRAGRCVVVFPGRTRLAAWKPAEFNSLGVKLAKRAGVPVIPLALRTDAWGIGKRIKDCGPIRPELPVHFAFGDPISVTGNGRDAQEAVVRFITGRMQAWGVPVIEGSEAGEAAE
jgi:1-acyl-sn-glycerol-3-phosphate acyltransferase